MLSEQPQSPLPFNLCRLSGLSCPPFRQMLGTQQCGCVLQGRFTECWDASGVQAGDVLSFRQESAAGKVTMRRSAAGAAGLTPSVAEQVG